jgi:hypothetical protein
MRNDPEYFEKACSIPKDLKHKFYPMKQAFYKSNYKKEIMDLVREGCKVFPYEESIESVPGTAFNYYLFEKNIIDSKKVKKNILTRCKSIIKKIIRIIFYVFGGAKKLYVSPIIFGALSQDGSTLITQEDVKLRDIVAHGKKDERASFNALQMQYYRLRNYKKVVVMDSKGVPWILLKNINFPPSERYNYTVSGELEYIKNVPRKNLT